MPSCVLAYSGGLDTSVILGWLQDEGYDVHAVYVDLGQPCEDREAILKKARDNGAKSAKIVDAREELCRDFAFPVLQWQAKYEGIYLLGTSIARPLISKVCLQVARDVGAEAYAHGATGKGNDQCRFQLAAEALEPDDQDHRPLADEKVPRQVPRPHRDDRLLRRQEHPGEGVDLQALLAATRTASTSATKPASSKTPRSTASPIVDFGMTVSPQQAPDKVEQVKIGFECGVPVSHQRPRSRRSRWSSRMNKIAGRNGVGRIDIVENRFVGMKSRGVYEAPGMTALYAAHLALEQLTLDRDTVHLRDRLAPEVAEMVYYGFWFVPKMDALMAFMREVQKPVTGEVTLGLYKGNVMVQSRTSPNSLYDAAIASMEAGGSYDQTDAEGFLRIQGLPSRVLGNVRPRKY